MRENDIVLNNNKSEQKQKPKKNYSFELKKNPRAKRKVFFFRFFFFFFLRTAQKSFSLLSCWVGCLREQIEQLGNKCGQGGKERKRRKEQRAFSGWLLLFIFLSLKVLFFFFFFYFQSFCNRSIFTIRTCSTRKNCN